jgi:glycosyltransferase involved in cell wall biosynthesis
MKIWLLTSETPLYNPGGIARYIDNFARYLARDGHEVMVFGRDEKQRDCEIEPGYRYRSVVHKWNLCGEKADSADPDKHPSYPYNILDYWGAFSYQMAEAVIEQINESGAPDIIESQEYCAVPYYLLQRKLTQRGPLEKVPVVVNAHSPDFITREHNQEPRYKMPHYWTGRLEMFCLRAADACICPSGFLSRELEQRFGNSLEVKHFPLPWTDPAAFDGDCEAVGGKALYFGRLEVRKGVLRLVAEAEKLWAEGLDFTLQLVGGDTHYFPRGCSVGEWLKKKHGKRVDEGRLVIRTAMPHGELMGEVKQAAFTIIPSIWENWPNTCIEAMSLGKVVVGSVHGGQAEMIGDDESCGFLFSWENPGSCESALRKALSLDDVQRQSMGAAAMQRIATLCEPGTVLKNRLQHFNEVIASHRPAATFPFVNRRFRNPDARPGPADGETAGRVTAVIPHYNLGGYLRAAVESVLEADWPDKEVIVVDDGSTDPESAAAVDRLVQMHGEKVRVLRQPNGGLASARNAGVKAATGEFILLLDADDRIEPGFVGKAVDVLHRFDNVHIVYSWERYMDASSDIFPCWNFDFPYLLGHNMTCPISVLYRQSYLGIGGSKPEMEYNFEDFELWINMARNGMGGVSLVEPLSLYRIRMDGMWQGSSRDQHLFLQDLITRFHPDLYREYGSDLFNLQNANGSAQKWIKPCSESPFDEYEQWSRRRIANLEKEAKKWWERSVDAERRLTESEQARHAVWCEKNETEKRLNEALEKGNKAPK